MIVTTQLRNAASVGMMMLLSLSFMNQVLSFTIPSPSFKSSSTISYSTISKFQLSMSNDNNSLVVISPPGGLGEITAVEAAKIGSSVRWFVISPPSPLTSSSSFSLSAATLETINANGGNVELAGAQADTLLLPSDDSASAVSAVSTWCGSNSGNDIVCTMDGIEEAIGNVYQEEPKEYNKATNTMMDAIKVAAREACGVLGAGGVRVAVTPADMDLEVPEEGEGDKSEGGGILGSLFGPKVDVPINLSAAMKGRSSKFVALRYGELFGIPESSPDASPLIGGPRRDPVIRDEYTMRSVRIDPTISVSGNTMMESSTRSSRLSIGEAAARMATTGSSDAKNSEMKIMDGLDVCLTSLRGLEKLSSDEWADEFNRVQEMMSSGQGAQLFSASFGSVPSTERLADWIATKWAPAVMRTYDIAGIRVGARPVYASRTGEGLIEIVWQELKDFKTNNVGKMIIEVTSDGMTAIRGPGDAAAGFGQTSRKPLNGEDILVRRLSDAATQAIEKGLATKPAPKKQKKKEVVAAPVVSTVVESGPIASETKAEPEKASAETGPRSAGARRSSERQRGKRRKKKSTE